MNGILSDPYLLSTIKCLVTIVALLIVYYDFRYFRIPNFLVISIAIFSLIKLAIEYQYLSTLNDLIFPVVLLVLFLLLLTKIYPDGIGGGDVKYLLALSIFFHWWIFPLLWLASLTGLVHFGFLKLLNKKSDRIPIGVHLGIFTVIFLILI